MAVWTRVTPHGMMSLDMSLIVGSGRYLLVTDRALEHGGMHGLKVSVETRCPIKQRGAVRAWMRGGGAAAVGSGRSSSCSDLRGPAPCCLFLSSLLSASLLFFRTENTRKLDTDTRMGIRRNKLAYLAEVWMCFGKKLYLLRQIDRHASFHLYLMFDVPVCWLLRRFGIAQPFGYTAENL